MIKIHCQLAPMAGVTDKPFRRLVRLFGSHLLHTEMIGANSIARSHPLSFKLMDISNEENIAIQLVGSNPENMVYAAQKAEKLGAVRIDINMGCPVKKLISDKSGASLMKYPEEALYLIKKIKESVSIPISAKIRIGWENNLNGINFAKDLEQAGISLLTVHGRTKEQGNSGQVNYSFIKKIKDSLSIPVLANGGAYTLDSALSLYTKAGCHEIMIAQGIIGAPWFLKQLSSGEKPAFSLKEIMQTHLRFLFEYYGEQGVFVMRKFLKNYLSFLEDSEEILVKSYTINNYDEIQKLIKNLPNF